MDLVPCEACTARMSPEAMTCPACGHPNAGATHRAVHQEIRYGLILLAIASLIFAGLAYGCQTILRG